MRSPTIIRRIDDVLPTPGVLCDICRKRKKQEGSALMAHVNSLGTEKLVCSECKIALVDNGTHVVLG